MRSLRRPGVDGKSGGNSPGCPRGLSAGHRKNAFGRMKIGVIGAGISGLVCARALHQQGHQVTVLEKSRSLGGRCATRKFGDHLVDHGLQYFTLRDPDVRREVEALAGDELLRLTAPILQAEPKGAVYREGEERFYLRSGNNRFGKMLAAELELVT
ncbi:MAG: FAD-dependent oxidoreductase, partial [Verrucomicrobia bacterium]|nr:FAD-dependent oxidoreductase [Verrucomicrobiota bacterium]